MNKHQKIAFGVVALLAFAFMVAWTTQLSGLGFVLALALVVALLTLPFTWRLIISCIKALGHVLSLIGHGIGFIGDWVIGKTNAGLTALSSSKASFAQQAPAWSELQPQPSKPGFLEEVLT